MSAPRFVNTTDGMCWTRREATRDGLELYALEAVGDCPAHLMETYAELEERGIVDSADVLPVPVGPQMPDFPPPPRTFEEKLRQDVARLQGLLAEAVRDAHRARSERDLIRERVSEPFGCKHCGVEKRSHGRRYIGGQGMHAWVRPSDEQVKARMLARRVARSPLPAVPELEQLYGDLTGAYLARWEEEQDNKRLRWALASAKRGRARLRAQVAELEALELGDLDGRVSATCAEPSHPTWLRSTTDVRGCPWCRIAELEAERHTTNEALDDAVQELRARQSCPCPSADQPGPHQVGCFFDGVPVSPPSERPVDGLTATFMPVASYREDPHDSPLHHDWRLGRDLPELGGV